MDRKANLTAAAGLAVFKSLSKPERDAVVLGIAADRLLRRDLLDLATIAKRQQEPSRSLRDCLAERRGK